MRIALCDDNELQLEILETVIHDLLLQTHRHADIKTFTSGMDLLQAVKTNEKYDIYILDIIMPGMNGMEVAGNLRLMKDKGHILFLTSSQDYAAQSYDVEAAYYFLKPIDPVKFGRVLERLMEKIDKEEHRLTVPTPKGDVELNANQILYVSTESRRPVYHLRDGQVLYGLSLRGKFRDEVQPLLDNPDFVICGTNYLFNLSGIDTVDVESIQLENGEVIYPSGSAGTKVYHLWLDWRKAR